MTAVPTRFAELESAIDEVARSYDGSLHIDNLESAALPSKPAVIEAFEHLKASLFVGFHATRTVFPGNLRQVIGEHLHAAHHLLAPQIERAFRYDPGAGTTPPTQPLAEGTAEDVLLGLLRAIPELRRILDSDVRAAFDGDPAAASVEEIVLSYPSVEAIVAYRIAHRLHAAGIPMLPRIITEHAHARTGIDLNPGATIGDRFFIDHGTGVVIGETSHIGRNVKIYQGVTLGALSVPDRAERAKKRHPTIEDGVTIYAGATILGGDTVVGAGSVIGGNVWLTSSVPPGSKVFGRGRGDDAAPTPPR